MRICDKCIHDKVCLLSKSRANCELFDEKRPHGEWIEKPWGVVCSRCKAQALHTPNGNQSRSDYCPDCGADMKEGDEK